MSGPTLWNNLPFSVKEAASLNIGKFKKSWKQFCSPEFFTLQCDLNTSVFSRSLRAPLWRLCHKEAFMKYTLHYITHLHYIAFTLFLHCLPFLRQYIMYIPIIYTKVRTYNTPVVACNKPASAYSSTSICLFVALVLVWNTRMRLRKLNS